MVNERSTQGEERQKRKREGGREQTDRQREREREREREKERGSGESPPTSPRRDVSSDDEPGKLIHPSIHPSTSNAKNWVPTDHPPNQPTNQQIMHARTKSTTARDQTKTVKQSKRRKSLQPEVKDGGSLFGGKNLLEVSDFVGFPPSVFPMFGRPLFFRLLLPSMVLCLLLLPSSSVASLVWILYFFSCSEGVTNIE